MGKEQREKKKLYETFFKYVSLNVLSMIGFSAFILADTFFIANGIGKDGLVALNIVIPAYTLIYATSANFPKSSYSAPPNWCLKYA